jgi:hypothetical protein
MLTCLPNEKPYREPTYEHPEMQMRYDTFPIGYEYVGAEAAADKWWTSELFRNVLEQWSKARGAPGVRHIDLDTVPRTASRPTRRRPLCSNVTVKSRSDRSKPGRVAAVPAGNREEENSLAHRRDL